MNKYYNKTHMKLYEKKNIRKNAILENNHYSILYDIQIIFSLQKI